ALSPLRWLVIGGEALSVAHVRRAQSVLANTTIVNGYGPTESTTFTCCNPIVEQVGASTRSVSIGRPIANTTVYLLDRKLNPVPIGVPGEAYIGGDGLAHGYVGQPALTAERFLPNPFGAPGSRMYRSGDLARYLRDGRIEFLGRADDQIKIRGYRIEPGEIENLLRELPTIRDAAVVARDDGRGGRALVAFVAPSTDASPNATELRAFLRETLPPHMVPATFVVLETLPLTATGKIDRRSLAAVKIETADSDRPIVAATSDLEHLLGAIWREVLNVERLSTDDNFFDLGGHSLLATRIVARIREELMCDLPLRAIFEHPTVASLARRIAGDGATQLEGGSDRFRGRHLFLLKGGSAGTPIFFLPGGSGGDLEFLVYARLVHFAGDGFAFYGLRARSADGIEHAHPTVEQMAADYIAEIRGVQPHGPYRLVGNCIGGVVAYEIARQLRAAGEEIGAVVLMDTDFPTSGEHLRRRWKETRSRWGFRVYRERLTHHLSVLRSVPWRQRFSYVVGRARNTPALLRQAPMLGTPIDPEERVRAGYIETLRRYRPRKYSGPVAIIASNHDDQDPTEGWSDVVEGRITVHRVHGDHESYIRVFVKEASLRLRACLAE
ncbi:MAG TPA: alpha/beta fold hydrolase, partial [Gemmatimonadaceae bacterium]